MAKDYIIKNKATGQICAQEKTVKKVLKLVQKYVPGEYEIGVVTSGQKRHRAPWEIYEMLYEVENMKEAA